MKSIFFPPIRNKKNILANFWIKRFSAPRFFTCAWVMLDSRSIWHVLINFKCLQSLFKCLQTYFSFIHSYIDYKNIPWARTNKTKVRKQFGNQKQAARIIFNQDRLTHACPLLKTLNAPNVYQINLLQVLLFMHKIKINSSPQIFLHQVATINH